ncbi:MAG: N-acetyl-gamma-glutamyl-phosphate reductase [Candidatus Melainabacteria bacterium]|nr:N-acetyl-gamma-glutamyl-phosphate reductase [Candidatus Melainabacteria bacterium]
MKTKVGILGATGYTGVVLTRLLMNHPEVEITYLSSEQFTDKYYYEVYPMFYDLLKEKCRPVNAADVGYRCDLVFFATPNGFAKDFLPKLIKENNDIKIIDLSADFRLETILALNKSKKQKNLKITYGLPEIHRAQIQTSQFISNPGCYPTSIILGLLPALKHKLINTNTIIIDSKSGASGAGKQLKPELHFCEVNESFSPYNLAGKHRHIPEIEKELSTISGENIKVVFSPHLLPISRGILSTIYAELNNTKINQKEISKLYSDFYKKEFFVKVLPEGTYANTRNVRYTNFCHLSPLKDERTNKLIIVSAIDNMVKGASGQAIQNMNIILSLKEQLGLDTLGQIP